VTQWSFLSSNGTFIIWNENIENANAFITYLFYCICMIFTIFLFSFLHLDIDFSKINAGWMGGAVTVILTGS
jgi:hypothetical protein